MQILGGTHSLTHSLTRCTVLIIIWLIIVTAYHVLSARTQHTRTHTHTLITQQTHNIYRPLRALAAVPRPAEKELEVCRGAALRALEHRRGHRGLLRRAATGGARLLRVRALAGARINVRGVRSGPPRVYHERRTAKEKAKRHELVRPHEKAGADLSR